MSRTLAERLRSLRRGGRPGPLAGERLLTAFAHRFPEAVFVEIGANDGDQHDHLRPLILAHAWRGVLVEPVPFVFERLAANYAGLERVALENVAIAERDGELPFFHLAPVDDHAAVGLPQWYDGIGSLSRDSVLGHRRVIPDIDDRVVETRVRCLTFDSLCAAHGLATIDLLLVDTEGHDDEILGTVDFDRYHPVLVGYEHYHVGRARQSRCRAFLDAAGYESFEEGFDTWCLRRDTDPVLRSAWERLRPVVGGVSVEDEPR